MTAKVLVPYHSLSLCHENTTTRAPISQWATKDAAVTSLTPVTRKKSLPSINSEKWQESLKACDVPTSKGVQKNVLDLLCLLHRPVQEALKPYLGAVIGLSREECNGSNKFDEKLREALEKHKEMLRSFNLERKNLETYTRKTIQFYDLDLLLIQKLIFILGIAECKGDWLWYHLKRDGSPIEARDGVIKHAIETSVTEILENLNLSNEVREAVFDIRPYDELNKKTVTQLISFFATRYGVKVAVQSDSSDLKPALLKVIGKDPDFDGARPDDVNYQLSRVLPKYTILSGWENVCPKYRPMHNTLRSNLVKCRNVDRRTCTYVAPYYAMKTLADRRLSLPRDCDLEELESLTSQLNGLHATSPERSLAPGNWLLVNKLTDLLCRYRYYICKNVSHGLGEAEFKVHSENIRLLFCKLDHDMGCSKWEAVQEDKDREELIIIVYQIKNVLREMSRLLLVGNEGAEDQASALRLLKRYNKRGQYQLALDMLRVEPDFSRNDDFELFYQCAMSHFNLARPKEAEENFKLALEKLPHELKDQFSCIYIDYAALLIGQGKFNDADRLLVENSIAPDWKIFLALGKCHVAAGTYDHAFMYYESATSRVTSNTLSQATVSSSLANVCLKRGGFSTALVTYKDVLEIAKSLMTCMDDFDASQVADLEADLVDALDSVGEVQESLEITDDPVRAA